MHGQCKQMLQTETVSRHLQELYLNFLNSSSDASDAGLQCANLVVYPPSERCLYDLDENNFLMSCRDGTHLQNCGRTD